MDREALVLFICWLRELALVVVQLRTPLITFQYRTCLTNLMTQRGSGYELRFRPSGVSDRIISIQRLSFYLRYSLSSLWIFSITITFKSSIE